MINKIINVSLIVSVLTTLCLLASCTDNSTESASGTNIRSNIVTPATSIQAPELVNASDGISSNKISIEWKAVTDAKYYIVYRSDSPDGEFEKISYKITSTSYDNTLVKGGTWYYYKVQALTAEGVESELSPFDGGYSGTKPLPLLAPIILTISQGGDVKINITWKAVTGADSYIIYRADQVDGLYKEIKKDVAITSYDDTTAIKGQWYFYKIKAANTLNELSELSISKKGYAGIIPVKPSAPTGIIASDGIYDGYIHITWDNDATIDHYIVYRSKSETGIFTAVSGSLKVENFDDKSITDNSTYYYKVSAFSTTAESDFSSIAAGSIKQFPLPEFITGDRLISGIYEDTSHNYTFNASGSAAMTQQDDGDLSTETYNGNWSYNGNNLVLQGNRIVWGWGYGKIEALYRKFEITLTKTFENVYTVENGSTLLLTGKKKITGDAVSIKGTYGYKYTVVKKVRVWSWLGSTSWGRWDNYSTETTTYDYLLTFNDDINWSSVLNKNGVAYITKTGSLTFGAATIFTKVDGSIYLYDQDNQFTQAE